METRKYYIGIDPGRKTGLAFWNVTTRDFVHIITTDIITAIGIVIDYARFDDVTVVFEDARKRKWFGNKGREALQGAGSVKRDCAIWEDFLKQAEIKYEAVSPVRNRTKLDAEEFGKLTGYWRRTSEHGRDAAMLVYGR